jgi:seryl-tRNA synthetase
MLNQISQRRAIVQARAFQPAFTRPCNGIRPIAAVAVEAPVTSTSAAAVDAPSFRANLDFKFIKENVELVTANCKNRFSSADPHKVVALYDEFVALKAQVDSLRAERNENSSAMKV